MDAAKKHADAGPGASSPEIDARDLEPVDDDLALREKALVRKLDARIIPLVMLLYLLSFLDR